MSHTPGPWAVRKAEGDELYEVYREAGGELITYAAATTKQRVNANLIAAAPALLEACELLLIYLGDWDDPEDETCVAARQAIAQAKGGV